MVFRFYGFFRSIRMIKAKPMIMATSRPMIAGMKYMSAGEAGASGGIGVACGAESATKLVSAKDGQ